MEVRVPRWSSDACLPRRFQGLDSFVNAQDLRWKWARIIDVWYWDHRCQRLERTHQLQGGLQCQPPGSAMVLEGESRRFSLDFSVAQSKLHFEYFTLRWFYRSIPKCVLESCNLLRGRLAFQWMDSKSCMAAMAHNRLPSRNGAHQIIFLVLTLGKLKFSFLCQELKVQDFSL